MHSIFIHIINCTVMLHIERGSLTRFSMMKSFIFNPTLLAISAQLDFFFDHLNKKCKARVAYTAEIALETIAIFNKYNFQ